ncbi:MAG: ExeM/NucH family extracellular endonuclease, partial [Acidimicrobiales bacterium]
MQGAGDATPLAGQDVRVEGVVTGDFNGPSQLGGVFIQDDTPDADPATSDGIFVFSGASTIVGDRVLVSGRAVEFNGLTELTSVTAVDVCGIGTIAPAAFDLPRPSGTTFEPVESVLLTFPETLTATEHFQLGRFGEVTVSSDGRLFQPTDRVAPGAPAQALQDVNNRRRLLIDDGSNVQNPPTVPFIMP